MEPLLWEQDLWPSMLLSSYKAKDLQRDSRVLVHSVVDNRDGAAGEYKVRGHAIDEPPTSVGEPEPYHGLLVGHGLLAGDPPG